MLVYGECECFVLQMLYVCVLCASCGSSQCCVLHDLQFVNAGRGCNRRPYRRGMLQSRSHNCFICSHECLLPWEWVDNNIIQITYQLLCTCISMFLLRKIAARNIRQCLPKSKWFCVDKEMLQKYQYELVQE